MRQSRAAVSSAGAPYGECRSSIAAPICSARSCWHASRFSLPSRRCGRGGTRRGRGGDGEGTGTGGRARRVGGTHVPIPACPPLRATCRPRDLRPPPRGPSAQRLPPGGTATRPPEAAVVPRPVTAQSPAVPRCSRSVIHRTGAGGGGEGGQSPAYINPGLLRSIHSPRGIDKSRTRGLCARGFATPPPRPPSSSVCAMLRDVGAVTVTCLQLLLLAGGAQPRPRAWDEDGQQLEAIKHGILRRLGMAGPPPVPHAPDPESISRARRLYERRVAELRGNRSREREEREGAAAATRWHRLTAIRKWTLRSRRAPGPRPPTAPPDRIPLSSQTASPSRVPPWSPIRVPTLHPPACPDSILPCPRAVSPHCPPTRPPAVSHRTPNRIPPRPQNMSHHVPKPHPAVSPNRVPTHTLPRHVLGHDRT